MKIITTVVCNEISFELALISRELVCKPALD